MSSLLVTGGAGFIGSHMVRQLLDAGHRVTVFDNLERGHADAVGEAELVVGDLLDREALDALFSDRGIEAVLHFAALAYVGESVGRPVAYYRNNVAGTLELLDAMDAHDVRRLVFSSTCATYGVPDALPIDERTPQRPINPYGRSKQMVEAVLRDEARARRLDSIALRYFNAAGAEPGGSLGERHDPETHLLPLILLEARRVLEGGDPADSSLAVFGDDFDTPDGTCVRDYIHVEDLCSAHRAALERLFANPGIGAEHYNLGTNRGYTVLECIDICRQITGVDIRYRIEPRREGDPPALVADASLARAALGWEPLYTELEPAVRHAWMHFAPAGTRHAPSRSDA